MTSEQHNQMCKRVALTVSVEKRQEFMDNMVKKHMNLGDASKAAEITFDEACAIMTAQIKSHVYLDPQIKE